MAKLNQIIAVEKGVKSQSLRDLTDAHQLLQKASMLSGISRTYRPKDEGSSYRQKQPKFRSRLKKSSAGRLKF
jgi:hypothetical protein